MNSNTSTVIIVVTSLILGEFLIYTQHDYWAWFPFLFAALWA